MSVITYPSRTGVPASNILLTPEGGHAVRMINDTGSSSVKGTVVSPSSSVNNGVSKIVVDIPNPIGVIYEDGVPNGGEVLEAEVYYIGNVTRGGLARGFLTGNAGYVAGQAMWEALPSAPFATDKHFYEIGHPAVSRTGPGLALTHLHFN